MSMDSIVLVGWHTKSYLEAVTKDLKYCGFHCLLTIQGPKNRKNTVYTLSISNYSDLSLTFQCHCLELNMDIAGTEILAMRDCLAEASHVIVVFPLKLFPAFRYNLDDSIAGIADWITPDLLQRTIHQAVSNKESRISWIITGTEQKTYSLKCHSNTIINGICYSKDETSLNENLHSILLDFFSEPEDRRFLEQCGKDVIVSLGFLGEAGISEIGEKTSVTWNMYGFLTAIKKSLSWEALSYFWGTR